jgi:hypothetical protein
VTAQASPAALLPLPDTGSPPADAVLWFASHGEAGRAREFARAEHAARRAGRTARWFRTWACEILSDEAEKVIEGETGISLDAHPSADPRARAIERRLIESAGLDDPASPGHDHYYVNWMRQTTCRVYAPGGTLLEECSDFIVPLDDPGQLRIRTASILAEMSR